MNKSYNQLLNTGALINYATAQARAPGSTFKVIDSSAIYDQAPQLASRYFKSVSSITLPDTTGVQLYNFAGEYCGGNLAQVSASRRHLLRPRGRDLGAQKLYSEAVAFGFDRVPPIDLPEGEAAASNFPTPGDFAGDTPGLMKSAIGQENVTATTLQMALVAAGIADNGVIMAPHLLHQIVDNEGNVVETYQPHAWTRATSPSTALAVRKLMLGVTENPLGDGLRAVPALPVPAGRGQDRYRPDQCDGLWHVRFAHRNRTGRPRPDPDSRGGGDRPHPSGWQLHLRDRRPRSRSRRQGCAAKGPGDAATSR